MGVYDAVALQTNDGSVFEDVLADATLNDVLTEGTVAVEIAGRSRSTASKWRSLPADKYNRPSAAPSGSGALPVPRCCTSWSTECRYVCGAGIGVWLPAAITALATASRASPGQGVRLAGGSATFHSPVSTPERFAVMIVEI
jgi:hypothetical protein